MTRKQIIWAYLVEFVLATIIWLFLYKYEKMSIIDKFNKDSCITLAIGFAGLALTIWLLWWSKLNSDFVKYLHSKKVDVSVRNVYFVQVIIFSVLALFLCVLPSLPKISSNILLFIELYALINCWTLFNNTRWLMKLETLFQEEFDKFNSNS